MHIPRDMAMNPIGGVSGEARQTRKRHRCEGEASVEPFASIASVESERRAAARNPAASNIDGRRCSDSESVNESGSPIPKRKNDNR